MSYRYIFYPGSTKFVCPACGQRRFVRYKDTQTGEYLPDKYGKCDRENKCGYHLNPYAKKYKSSVKSAVRIVPVPKRTLFPIPQEVLYNTLGNYQENTLVQYLISKAPHPFTKVDVEKVVSLYYIGTIDLGMGIRSGFDRGYATTFPFIDRQNNIRAIQAKKFNDRGHSSGQPNFVHRIIEGQCTRNRKPIPGWIKAYETNESKVTCIFGEHLLDRYPHNPIVLVEAPKTAVIGTLYFGFPEDQTRPLWLAAGSLGYLTADRCRGLEGRNVFLFPDLSLRGTTYQKWSDRAIELRRRIPKTKFTMSDLLEQGASGQDRFNGADLADYLLRLDWRYFRKDDSLF